jgi:hypothetical protein
MVCPLAQEALERGSGGLTLAGGSGGPSQFDRISPPVSHGVAGQCHQLSGGGGHLDQPAVMLCDRGAWAFAG